MNWFFWNYGALVAWKALPQETAHQCPLLEDWKRAAGGYPHFKSQLHGDINIQNLVAVEHGYMYGEPAKYPLHLRPGNRNISTMML